MSIPCPKCQTPTKHFKDKSQIELDLCPSCFGMWFETEELQAYGAFNRLDANNMDIAGQGRESALSCPSCKDGQKLVEMRYHPDEELLVDACPKCRGIFLEAKELGSLRNINKNRMRAEDVMQDALLQLKKRGFTRLG